MKGIFIKLAYAAQATPLDFVALRFGFAMPVFAWIAWKGGNTGATAPRPAAKDWALTALAALLGYYAASFMDFEGLRFISVGLERIILYLHPTLVVLLIAALGRRRIRRVTWAALGCSYLGLALCFSDEIRVTDHHGTWLGAGLILGSAACYALFLVLAEGLISRIGTHRFTATGMLIATVIFVFQDLVHNPHSFLGYGPRVYGLALGMAVVGTLLPVYLFGVALQRIGASRLCIAGMVGPVSVLPLAGFFLGESAGVLKWVGFAFTLVGGIILTREKK